MLDGVGHDSGLDVRALLALEEHVRIHRRAPGGGVLRVQAVLAERRQLVIVHQLGQVVIVQRLDPLHLVGGAEAVEKVQEGMAGLDSGQVRHGA